MIAAPRMACAMAAIFVATGACAAATAVVEQPRPFGYVVGDVITQRVLLEIDGHALAPATLPKAERVNVWLERRPARIEADRDEEVGKYNGGQKLFFHAAALASLALLVSGIVLWLPESFPQVVRLAAILLHDVTFILFAAALVLHIYLPAAQPGTYRAMVRGTVSGAWARLHHPRWYREVRDGVAPRP